MDDIELIKQRINIVDLISEYLPLKKAGVNFKANCPFHQERTPSFMVSPERGIWHCFGCFPPGELIKTPFGYHKIEEVDKNHWVISGKGNLRKVTDVMIHQYKGNLVKVVLRKLGGVVSLTSDHNVFVVRGAPYLQKQYKNFSRRYNKFFKFFKSNTREYFRLISQYTPIQKIPAGRLQKGDLLLYPLNRGEKDLDFIDLSTYLTSKTRFGPTPKNIPLKVKIDNEFLKLVGYWVAEGSNHRAYIRFSLGNHEEDFAQEIVRLIKKIFGLDAKIHRRKVGIKTGLEITACHSQLSNIFENFCGKGTASKHLPFIFQELPPHKQKILLEAIFKGDGNTFVANRSQNKHKAITTVSKVLAEQLIDILLRLNIFPSKSVRGASIDKKNVNHQEVYRIFWSEESKQKYNLTYYEPDGSEYWLLPIVGLKEQSYEGPVHNFSVAYDHSYVATNFAVGNCDKGGDIFKFVMEKEGLDFPESLELLAQKAGVTLKKSKREKNTTDRLYEINLKAAQFFHYLLIKHKIGQKALKYLTLRGLTDKTISEFNLGYAPQNWETLTNFLKKRGFSTLEIVESGLGVASQRGCYDRFRGRIMFPLIDVRNRVLGFSGRVLDSSEPKYINSPQTPIFDKKSFLLGLHLTKSQIKEEKSAIVVEGEMDLLMSYQVGVKNIVASKGTALTVEQIDLLKKYAQTILLCFDTDLAGDAASRRGIELADQAGLNIKVIQFEGSKDPAELSLKDPKGWEKAVKEAVPIYDYYLTSIGGRFNLKDASSKSAIMSELLPIWKKITDPIVKGHYIQKLAAYLQVKDDFLRKELDELQTGVKIPVLSNDKKELVKPKNQVQIPRDRRKLLEEYLISLLLHLPKDHTYIPNFPETLFTQEEYKQTYVLLVLFLDSISFKGRAFKIAEFIKTLPEQLIPLTDRLYLTPIDEKLEEASFWQKEVEMVVSELKKMLIKSSLEKLSLQIKNAQEFDKLEVLEALNKRFRDLSVKLKNL